MSIFSRGSKKRKDFVKKKMQETKSETKVQYTDKKATEEYMQKKRALAEQLIPELKQYCTLLCDPRKLWKEGNQYSPGRNMLRDYQFNTHQAINIVTRSDTYKNAEEDGSSSKYLQQVNTELGKLLAVTDFECSDPVNLKSSMQSCGKSLSKLKHPIGSTALVKLGKKGERIVDYVDELARLMLIKSVQENAAILLTLAKGAEWPIDEGNYTYEKVEPKYVEL